MVKSTFPVLILLTCLGVGCRETLPPALKKNQKICKGPASQGQGGQKKILGGKSVAQETTDPRVQATVSLGGCTAGLINSKLVVTAAHCIKGRPTVTFDWDLRTGGKPVSMQAQSFKAHPNWSKNPRHPHEADIAYIVLPQSAPKGYTPLPVLSDTNYLKPGKTMVTLLGFGATSDKGGSPGHLRAVDIIFKGLVTGRKGMVMVGPEENKGACFGDSGGLQTVADESGSRHFAVGVTSGFDGQYFPELNGKSGCRTGAAIYTQIFAYLDWIEKESGEKALTSSPGEKPEENKTAVKEVPEEPSESQESQEAAATKGDSQDCFMPGLGG